MQNKNKNKGKKAKKGVIKMMCRGRGKISFSERGRE
jgi:hypothetical protein